MFKFQENDIVVFHTVPYKLFIVTLPEQEGGDVYLTAGDSHSTMSHYMRTGYGAHYTVLRTNSTCNKALLKRLHGVNSSFDLSSPPSYFEEVHSTLKEYTMAELERIVGHPFKLVK